MTQGDVHTAVSNSQSGTVTVRSPSADDKTPFASDSDSEFKLLPSPGRCCARVTATVTSLGNTRPSLRGTRGRRSFRGTREASTLECQCAQRRRASGRDGRTLRWTEKVAGWDEGRGVQP